MLDALKDLGIRVGVSLDGDAEATGRHRRLRQRPQQLRRGRRRPGPARVAEFRDFYSGILCTVDVHNDPVDHLRGAAEVQPARLGPAATARELELPAPGHRVRGLADRDLRALVLARPSRRPGSACSAELIQLVLGQPGAVEGLGLLPEHADRGGNRRLHQAARLAELGLSRCRRHRTARPGRLLRCRPGSPHDGRQADRRGRAVAAVPDAARSWRSAAAACIRTGTGAARDSATPRSTATTCCGSSRTCRAGSTWTAGREPDSRGLQASTVRSPRSAGSACRRPGLGMLRVSVCSYRRSASASRRSPQAGVPESGLVAGQVGRRHQRVRMVLAQRVPALVQGLLAELDRLGPSRRTRRGRRRS